MLFGIIALIVTGASWSIVGIVMGSAPKHKVDTSFIQFFGSLFSILACIVLLLSIKTEWSNAMYFSLICYTSAGLLNFLLLQLMSIAMQHGPNGTVWMIVQSGIIFPFTMGILFFAVPLPFTRICGMIILIAALFLFGRAKGNGGEKKQGNWLIPAFAAFILCGIQQSITNLPSYYPELTKLNPAYRTIFTSSGVIFGAFCWNLFKIQFRGFKPDWTQLRNKYLWLYILLFKSYGLVTSYFLLYRGMDALAKAGAGSIAYPLLVSSCIIGFFLYSVLLLKEKNRPIQYAAFILCLTGIVLISL